MAKFGCPQKFVNIVHLFHDGMEAFVKDIGQYSKPSPVTNWVKQGFVIAPNLFSMIFSAMLTGSEDAGIELRSHTDSGFSTCPRDSLQTLELCWTPSLICPLPTTVLSVHLVKMKCKKKMVDLFAWGMQKLWDNYLYSQNGVYVSTCTRRAPLRTPHLTPCLNEILIKWHEPSGFFCSFTS